ncbi:MAG: hypothetical protein RJQ00_10665 [Vicingaceae bacterium]
MKRILFLTTILMVNYCFAQHSTMRFTNEPIRLNQESVLMVPFESKMYLSDINKELAEENNLTADQIIQRFINGIDQSIYYTFRDRCNITSFYELQDGESGKDLNYIYDNLKLEYELVSKGDQSSGFDRMKNKFKKKEDQEYKRGEIRDGEIYSERDERERYMKAVVENNEMLDSMHFKFDNSYFLFITELDIKNLYTDAIAMQSMDYDREIKVHYTLYYKNGEILSTGVSATTFPGHLNNIDKIISGYFPILAQNIYVELFPDESKAEESKIDLKIWK